MYSCRQLRSRSGRARGPLIGGERRWTLTAHQSSRRSRLANAFKSIRRIDDRIDHYFVDVPDPSLDGPASRRHVANRFVVLALIGIAVSNLAAAFETVVMIQLVMTGGELS